VSAGYPPKTFPFELQHPCGLLILNGLDPFYRGAPLWHIRDPRRNGSEYLIHEFTAWAAEEEADELLGLA
jgi:hypothetical protein